MFSNKIIIFAQCKISMKKSIYIYLYISLTISLNGQVINNQELYKGTSIQRNTLFNLDEILFD
jgi:hypothetical protein